MKFRNENENASILKRCKVKLAAFKVHLDKFFHSRKYFIYLIIFFIWMRSSGVSLSNLGTGLVPYFLAKYIISLELCVCVEIENRSCGWRWWESQLNTVGLGRLCNCSTVLAFSIFEGKKKTESVCLFVKSLSVSYFALLCIILDGVKDES